MQYELFFQFRPQFDIRMYYKIPEVDSKKCPQDVVTRNKNITNYRFGWTFMETWLCNKEDIDIKIIYECERHDDNFEKNGTRIRENTSSIRYEHDFAKLNGSLIKKCIKIAACECPLQCKHASLCETLRLSEKDVAKGKWHFQFFILLIFFISFIGLCVIYFKNRIRAPIHPFISWITQ